VTGGPRRPPDWRRWRSARSLGALAELTALWLEGEIGYHPALGPSPGPDGETAPLVPALAVLCRAGYLTTASRSALPRDAGGWEQRAAVHGFAGPETVLRAADAAMAAGLHVVTVPPGQQAARGDAVTVTRRRGVPVTSFSPLQAGLIRSPLTGWGLCHPDAVAALCGAWQVTVADPDWDRGWLLWQRLQAALAPRAAEPG
jgi:hypothetical protein